MDKTYDRIIEEIAEEFGYDKRVISTIIKDLYANVVEVSRLNDVEEIKSEEDFEEVKTNIRIPGLGKVVTNWSAINTINKKREYKRLRRHEEAKRKSIIQQDSNNNE